MQVKQAVRYVRVMIEKKLTCWGHIKKAADIEVNVTTRLSRLMANIGGLESSKRRVLMAVTQPILLYGPEIWANSFRNQK